LVYHAEEKKNWIYLKKSASENSIVNTTGSTGMRPERHGENLGVYKKLQGLYLIKGHPDYYIKIKLSL
jgi:hypothetical protein